MQIAGQRWQKSMRSEGGQNDRMALPEGPPLSDGDEMIPKGKTSRVVVWFSCGAASAVAAKLGVDEYGDRAIVVYCNTMASEHQDNPRFMRDVEKWIGRDILIIGGKYDSVDEVFKAERYMAGVRGAKCTVEMKKVPRFKFQEPDDVHVFGYTSEEGKRIRNFSDNNPELLTDWILLRHHLTKINCMEILMEAGIILPAMYQLGFKNNNCIGCVKATSPTYWNRVRKYFPAVFERRCQQSRELGVKLVQIKRERVFLDQLPEAVEFQPEENISCGPECGVQS